LQNPSLELTDVSKRFEGASLVSRLATFGQGRLRAVEALRGVSMRVEPGEVVGLLGPVGSGKSTLLRCAAGLIKPDAGLVRVGGADPAALAAPARGAIGLVGRDDRTFLPRLSATANLEIYAALHGLGGAVAAERIRDVLHAARLHEAAREQVGTYSDGMRQRLAIARALLGRPALLLIDDAAGGLEKGVRGVVHAVIAQLAAEDGVAVLLATHDLAEAQYVCTRLVLLDEGRVVADGEYLAVEEQAEALSRRDRQEAGA
jgi:ABC-2 type transport system ATP-binding protein